MESRLNIGPLSMDKTGLKRDALSGEIAVVTGAGSNIGLATARSLAWLGAKVVIAEINGQTGPEAEALINGENKPGTALFVETDVSSESSMNAMRQKAFDAFGKVDILVNDAMDMSLGATILKTTPEVLDRQYAIATRGALLGIRAFVPGMLERHHGVVTYISTVFRYPMSPSNYCAVKAATSSMIMSLAAELGDVEKSGVAVFMLVPTWVGRPPKDEQGKVRQKANFAVMPSVIGYDGQMPPEDCGAALSYCIVHASEIHGSGVTAGQVHKHIGWTFPRPDLVPKREFDRVRDAVAVRIFGYQGDGFPEPKESKVSINRSASLPGEPLNLSAIMKDE
jgi:NAD(P)-dependent dehydrogenase (short-subunit alcohol dehydrogenase family)